jgi:hypothetical protein
MRNHKTIRPPARIICLGLFASLIVATATQHLLGQAPAAFDELAIDQILMTKDLDTDEMKLDDKKVRALTAIKTNILLGNVTLQEQLPNFKMYYSYLFRSFSQLNQVAKLPERRQQISDDLRRARTKEVHDALLADTQFYMKGFITSTKKNFHPAVRYNAMLVIGDLNQDEVSSTQRFPNPLPSALDFLITEYKKPNQTESLKLAALLGIYRHAQLDFTASRIPADRRTEITGLMLALANAKDPPAGSTPEGHLWMQRRAIDVLAALGTVGANVEVNKTLVSYVRNPDADILLRCTAANSLSRLTEKMDKAKLKATIDPSKELWQLGALLVQVCQNELDHMKQIHRDKYGITGAFGEYGTDAAVQGMPSGMPMMSSMPSLAGMSGMMSGGGMPDGAEGMGGMGGASYTATGELKDPYVDLFRRRLKSEIQCVQLGLAGVKRLYTPPPTTGRKVVDPFVEMNKAIETVRTATDPVPQLAASIPGLHKSIKDSMKDLEKLTASVMPKPKPKPVDPNAPVDAQAGAAASGVVGQGAAATPVAGPAGARPQMQAGVPQNNPALNVPPNVGAGAAGGMKPAANAAAPAGGANAASDAPPGVSTMPVKPPANAPKPAVPNPGATVPPNAKK